MTIYGKMESRYGLKGIENNNEKPSIDDTKSAWYRNSYQT